MLSVELAGTMQLESVPALSLICNIIHHFVHLAVSQTAPEYLQPMLVDAALDLLHSKL